MCPGKGRVCPGERHSVSQRKGTMCPKGKVECVQGKGRVCLRERQSVSRGKALCVQGKAECVPKERLVGCQAPQIACSVPPGTTALPLVGAGVGGTGCSGSVAATVGASLQGRVSSGLSPAGLGVCHSKGAAKGGDEDEVVLQAQAFRGRQ